MTPREYWSLYVEQNGGLPAIADKTGVPYSTLAAVTNGQRGIGKALAQRLKDADPLIDATRLVWVQPIREHGADQLKAG